MKQFTKILSFELKNFFKNKVFVGTTVFLVILIAVLMFIPQIKALVKSDASSVDAPAERPVMLVKMDDSMRPDADMVQETFAASFADYDVQITEAETDALQDKIASGEAECAFVLTDWATFTYYVDTLAMYDVNADIASDVLQQLYQMNAMITGGIAVEEATSILNLQITGEVESLGKDQMQNFFYTYIMIFALYMVILLYGQMVATNVATEKSSRAMELLITSAKPTAMMFGKIIASCLAGFIQLIAVFGSALLFFNLNKTYWSDNMIISSIFNIPVELLVYMLVFFVLGFLIYAFLFGAVGSMASKLEDVNTLVTPIILLFVLAFMVVMFSTSSGNINNALMVVCSYVPFTSPMAMFSRIAMSIVPWYEIVISIVILIASTVGMGILAAKIYRVGVLMYGTTPKIGNIIKAVRRA